MKRCPRSSEEEIVKLREDVEGLWRGVEALLPEELRDLLKSYWECSTVEEAIKWHGEVVARIMASAEPQPGSPARVLCPLCKGSATSPYDSGFRYPTGLLRHLTGEHNAYECPIMRASRVRAIDYTFDKHAQEFRRHLAKLSAEMENRRPKPAGTK